MKLRPKLHEGPKTNIITIITHMAFVSYEMLLLIHQSL